jgi:hypothetical protein
MTIDIECVTIIRNNNQKETPMTNLVEATKIAIRQRSWKNLKVILDTRPATHDVFEEFAMLLWHADSMVRRRPGDDGIKRDQLLASFGTYYEAHGVANAVNDVGEMRSELLKIDRGYQEIHSVVPKMKSAEFTPEERIAGIFGALDYAIRQTLKDANKKIDAMGVIGANRNFHDAENNSYDPNSNTHGLAVAAGDVLMLEAYRNGWFDDSERIILPNFERVAEDVVSATVANLINANMWRMWKNVDERVRFLGGDLKDVSNSSPAWESQIKAQNPGINIDAAFEFVPNIKAEHFELLANERLDRILEQNLQKMLRETNVREKVGSRNDVVALPPNGLVSIDEAHAGATLGQLTKTNITKTSAGPLLLSERLRGYAVLKLLIVRFEAEQKTYFPRVARTQLLEELARCGLTVEVATKFIEMTTFGRSSRDLYDHPLVKTIGDDYFLFGSSLVMADLVKIVFSSLSNEGSVIADKGEIFEEETIKLLCHHGFKAQKLKVSRGPNKEHEFDYDVAFTWDDYVFFFECKNRGIPMGNPIATYYFNQELQDHFKQVQRLQQGLIDYPDILEKDFPEAVGKKQVFCLVNALPFAVGQVDPIYVFDDAILRRFFSSSAMGVSAGRLDGLGPQLRTNLRKLWSGSKPTASDFIAYINTPPQLVLANENYEVAPRIERLSLGAFAKITDFRRKDLDDDAIAKILSEQ